MFYSHEVLTSRKYGVATVWLVATLGSSSKHKKVSRKAILEVDVQKACDTIVAPAAPMALRLQSNLLYGVACVYSQQCGYMLHDAEAAKNNMRLLLKAMQGNTLDATGENSGRSDQLMLQDDPNFLPDFNLLPQDLDRMELDLGLQEESHRSLLSPYHSQRASIRSASSHDIGGLMIPPSASSFSFGPTGFSGRGGSSAGGRMNIGGLDDDYGLVIDEDGNLHIRGDEEDRVPPPPQSDGRVSVRTADSRARSVGAVEQTAGDYIATLDDDGFLPLQDDEPVPASEVHTYAGTQQPVDGEQNQDLREETSEETATAPVRRRTRPALKLVPLDNANGTELHNRDLAQCRDNYVANMRDAIHKKAAKDVAEQAKRNAEIWMLSRSDVGPLSMFTGIRLLEALTWMDLRTPGQKRTRDQGDEPVEERRVRQRGSPSSQEAGRGVADDAYAPVIDDNYMPVMEDDTIEQGREAPTPLEERGGSSIMPWNQSAGSRRGTGFYSAGGFPTSNSLGGMSQRFGGLSHRRSRLTSASPLLGRGAPAGNIDDFQIPFQDDDLVMPDAEDFELYGAAANVDTQTADASQWQRIALDGESEHFLGFVQHGIVDLDRARVEDAIPRDEEDETLSGSIEFAALLPEEQHSKIVAVQALLHVLSLGTKDLLRVQQDEAFGAIVLRMHAVAA